jgi:hypothetical protein
MNNSKLWIFQSDRELTDTDIKLIEGKLLAFIPSWAAHGNNLSADYDIKYNYFVQIMVDQSTFDASGCSIDSMTRVIKELGTELGIDFFNRMNVIVKSEESLQLFKALDLKNIPVNSFYFDNTIQSTDMLESNWLIPISKGWLGQRLS